VSSQFPSLSCLFSYPPSLASSPCLQVLLDTNMQQNLQIVVNVAKEYTEQLTAEKIIELLEAHKSYHGLYFYLGSYIAFSENPEVRCGGRERVLRLAWDGCGGWGRVLWWSVMAVSALPCITMHHEFALVGQAYPEGTVPSCASEIIRLFHVTSPPPLTRPQVHYKYIEAAAKTGQLKEVERATRESNFYPPERVKTFLMEVRCAALRRAAGGRTP